MSQSKTIRPTFMSGTTLAFLLGMVALMVMASGLVVLLQRHSPYSQSRIGGPFSLTEMTGQTVTEKALLGKPTAIYFGFTYCPEVCPTTLLMLSGLLKQLGSGASRLNVVFVTVDPQRDTAEQMKLYLSSFDPRIRGFTGTDQQVASIADTYHIFYRRVPTGGGGYTMDHFAGILLFDRAGKLAGEIPYGESENEVLAKLQTLIRPKACVPGQPAPVDLWSGMKTKDLCQAS